MISECSLQSCSVHVISGRDGILSLSPVMVQQRRYILCVSSHGPAETVYSLCLQSWSSRDGIFSVSPVMFGTCHLQQRRYTLRVSSHAQCMSSPAEMVYSLCLQPCSSRDGILSVSPVMLSACHLQQRWDNLCLQSCSSRDGILSVSPVMLSACHLQQRWCTLFFSSHVRCMHCLVLAWFGTCAQLRRPIILRGSQWLDRVCQCSLVSDVCAYSVSGVSA